MTAAKTGIDAQFGIVKESTYGTRVTPTKFYEFRKESLKQEIERIFSQGLRKGKFNRKRAGMYASHKKGAAGSLELEVFNKGFGYWLELFLGKVVTSQPDAGGNPTVYDHTGSVDSLSALSFTAQVGRPDVLTGTVRPFDYYGCTVKSWELGAAVGELAVCTVDIDAREEDTAQALATAAYPSSPSLLSFLDGKLTIAAVDTFVRSAKIKGDNALKTDRYGLQASPKKKQPSDGGRAISGQAEAEFEDLTAYNRFVNGTEAALTLLFEGATITGIYKYTLKVDCTVLFSGETPNVDGPDALNQTLPFDVLDDSLTILYRTTDTTP